MFSVVVLQGPFRVLCGKAELRAVVMCCYFWSLCPANLSRNNLVPPTMLCTRRVFCCKRERWGSSNKNWFVILTLNGWWHAIAHVNSNLRSRCARQKFLCGNWSTWDRTVLPNTATFFPPTHPEGVAWLHCRRRDNLILDCYCKKRWQKQPSTSQHAQNIQLFGVLVTSWPS